MKDFPNSIPPRGRFASPIRRLRLFTGAADAPKAFTLADARIPTSVSTIPSGDAA